MSTDAQVEVDVDLVEGEKGSDDAQEDVDVDDYVAAGETKRINGDEVDFNFLASETEKGSGDVEFDVSKVQELCTKVEELLLITLNESGLLDIGSRLGVTSGRITNKSKLCVLKEISAIIEKCSEGDEPSLKLSESLRSDLKQLKIKNDVCASKEKESEERGGVDGQEIDEDCGKKRDEDTDKEDVDANGNNDSNNADCKKRIKDLDEEKKSRDANMKNENKDNKTKYKAGKIKEGENYVEVSGKAEVGEESENRPNDFKKKKIKGIHINAKDTSKKKKADKKEVKKNKRNTREFENYFLTQRACIEQINPTCQPRELTNITTSSPFELISLDFFQMESSAGGYEYVLVIVDHFTRFAECYATRNKSGKTAADRLFNDFVLRHGFPNRVMHEQGSKFENELFEQLEELSGIRKSRTTPYHPQSNGKCERFNCKILVMLRTLDESQNSRWKDHLQKVVHAYNSTVSSATGFSPFYLLYGRVPRLPDVLETTEVCEPKPYRAYVDTWQRAMKEAYKIAIGESEKQAKRNRPSFHCRATSSVLDPGDRLLARTVKERAGLSKLHSFNEETVYKSNEGKDDDPVCWIESEKAHRSLMSHCGDELLDPSAISEVAKTAETEPLVSLQEEKLNGKGNRDPDKGGSNGEDVGQLQRPTRTRRRANSLKYVRLEKPPGDSVDERPDDEKVEWC